MHLWPRNGITVNKIHLTWNNSSCWLSGRRHCGHLESPEILKCLPNWKALIQPSCPWVHTNTFNIKSWILFLSWLWQQGLEGRHANMTLRTCRGQKVTVTVSTFLSPGESQGSNFRSSVLAVSAFTTDLSCQPQGIQYKNIFFNFILNWS